MTAEVPFLLLRCPHCGWVHCSITIDEILPGADLARLRRCFDCHAPATDLEPCTADAAPLGVTIQGVLYEPPEACKLAGGDAP